MADYPAALDWIANDTLAMYGNAPIGYASLGGVPFDIRGIFGTQGEVLRDRPTIGAISVDPVVEYVDKVYLLINSGATYLRFQNRQLGIVELQFVRGSPLQIPLIVGGNIREWLVSAPDVVTTTTSSSSQEVWRVGRTDGSVAVLDMLTIDVPDQYKRRGLTRILFSDTSETTVGSLDPGFFVAGVTILGAQ